MSTLSLFYAPFRPHPMLCLCVCVCVSCPVHSSHLPRDSLLVILSVLVCVCVVLLCALALSFVREKKEEWGDGECVRQESVTAGREGRVKSCMFDT